MFFISDLDYTLIYSLNALKKLNGEVVPSLHCVEEYPNEGFSFLTEKAYKYCQLLINKDLFIPATTRTINQYNRLTLSTRENLPWAIAYNGAVILRNGFIEKAWDNYIREELKNSLDFENMEEKLLPYLNAPWLIQLKKVGTWFFYFIVDLDKVTEKIIESLDHLSKKNNWVFSIQGRKLYFIPKCIDKGKAASYIVNISHTSKYIAAGDSLLDKNLIYNSYIGYIPTHGELYKQNKEGCFNKKNIKVAESKGLYCGEYILREVTDIFKSTLNRKARRKK